MTNQSDDDNGRSNRRNHPRLEMTVPVSIDLGDGNSIAVQNRDISWGGVRFVVPKTALPDASTVTVTFPWSKGDSFSARAEIVRREELDDEHAVVAARFSSLSAADQRRLEKLLTMLHAVGDETRHRREPLVPVLEVLFNDADEIRAKLDELTRGELLVTVFESYDEGQSIRLVIGGIGNQPALRLRARVKRVEYLTSETDSAWPMFTMALHFEHPVEELRAAAKALLAGLPEQRSVQQEQQSEGDLTLEED